MQRLRVAALTMNISFGSDRRKYPALPGGRGNVLLRPPTAHHHYDPHRPLVQAALETGCCYGELMRTSSLVFRRAVKDLL